MQEKIDAIAEAITSGVLTLADAVHFTACLASESWGEVAKLYKHLLDVTIG